MPITCKFCRFYNAATSRCQINPPVRLPRPFADDDTRTRVEIVAWGWPEVSPHDWCGQFNELRR